MATGLDFEVLVLGHVEVLTFQAWICVWVALSFENTEPLTVPTVPIEISSLGTGTFQRNPPAAAICLFWFRVFREFRDIIYINS